MGPLTGLPPEIIAGWVLWLAGGLGLMLWFRRRSAAAPRARETVRRVPPTGALRLSGTEPATGRPPAVAAPPDTFSELQALLDSSDQPPR